ncbi:MAG: hypothetical protein CMM47_05790 [Rhodospirillaceae bacterium]|nr:hypothetical protein [Rhodospirillaceae bacterium]
MRATGAGFDPLTQTTQVYAVFIPHFGERKIHLLDNWSAFQSEPAPPKLYAPNTRSIRAETQALVAVGF